MTGWKRKCNKFTNVRKAINDGDTNAIMEMLLEICREYAEDGDKDFAWEFQKLADEIDVTYDDGQNEEFTDEDADYWLSEFYDLCDAMRVWLAID